MVWLFFCYKTVFIITVLKYSSNVYLYIALHCALMLFYGYKKNVEGVFYFNFFWSVHLELFFFAGKCVILFARPGEGGSVGLLPTKTCCVPLYTCAGVTGAISYSSATPAHGVLRA